MLEKMSDSSISRRWTRKIKYVVVEFTKGQLIGDCFSQKLCVKFT